jgi:hypothetical protein
MTSTFPTKVVADPVLALLIEASDYQFNSGSVIDGVVIHQEDLLGEEQMIYFSPVHAEAIAMAIPEAARSLQQPTKLAKVGR